ncbi:hypothetical protein AM305_00544 [Actinobacillus minor NM305]|uniref:Uncharacterized protein n=1 Tax=Actinobacillus minor NM305 TaxID=637911 RepID=C5S3Q1_9PAST|nr:hypothetical protein [Actinobacillus minor]EER46499.1 hypothetical protein AM305_00544 [Actinobacillus minor NM305]
MRLSRKFIQFFGDSSSNDEGNDVFLFLECLILSAIVGWNSSSFWIGISTFSVILILVALCLASFEKEPCILIIISLFFSAGWGYGAYIVVSYIWDSAGLLLGILIFFSIFFIHMSSLKVALIISEVKGEKDEILQKEYQRARLEKEIIKSRREE